MHLCVHAQEPLLQDTLLTGSPGLAAHSAGHVPGQGLTQSMGQERQHLGTHAQPAVVQVCGRCEPSTAVSACAALPAACSWL